MSILAGASCGDPPSSPSSRVVLTDIDVVDVAAGRILPDRTVTVEDGWIAFVDSGRRRGKRGWRADRDTSREPGPVTLGSSGRRRVWTLRTFRCWRDRTRASCSASTAGRCTEKFEELIRAGLTTAEALRGATLAPARFLGIDDSTGSVEPGKKAHLVILDGDLLEDIRNPRRVHTVIQGRHVLDRRELDSLLMGVRAEVSSER